MKFFTALAVALFLALPAARAQENPDDQYVIIYTLIQQGDTFMDSGQPQRALEDYVEARQELQKFQQVYSDWNPTIVNFRLNYLADKIAALTPQVTTTNAPPAPPPPTPADWQSQLETLNARVRQLQTDNDTLQAKLKEALSVQPETISPEALAKIQQQVSDLAHENELLKAAVAQATNAAAQANPKLQQDLAGQTARANELARQNKLLQAQIQTLAPDANAAEALREENALLKKELAGRQLPPAATGSPETENADLDAARKQILQLESEAAENWLEKTALEDRIKRMEQQVALAAAATESGAPASPDLQSRVDELTKEVQTLRARVAADEAQPVPYTAQELALFTPGPVSPNTNTNAMPGGTAVLVAQAGDYYNKGQYKKAAADYHKVLKHDQNDPTALANLASTELAQNNLAAADKDIQAAIAMNPNDAFSLTVLGRLKFLQGQYDDSLDALDQAAKLEPQNSQIQDYLGVALAEKGLRAQAETAFRKAIEINPNYGDAHKNLAIIYLSANPPKIELARWHYEKALASGVPPNMNLEKMLDQASPAASQQ